MKKIKVFINKHPIISIMIDIIGFSLITIFILTTLSKSNSDSLSMAIHTQEPTVLPYVMSELDKQEKKKCTQALSEQANYLKKENLSDKFTFDKYKGTDFLTREPADLDLASNHYAREFRTAIRADLEYGVDFAGHYTIVSVGMTGWGHSYWIVDRINGKAYNFPYLPYILDYEEDSNLIIMNPKQVIEKMIIERPPYYEYGCGNVKIKDLLTTDLRPFYFLWENNKLKLLGPTDIKPPINEFWEKYFD